jgi:hypothetical protein
MMSLDFVLVKPKELQTSLAEFERDECFEAADFRALADRLFGLVEWQPDGTGFSRARRAPPGS